MTTDPYAQQAYNPYAQHDEPYHDYQAPTFGKQAATRIRVKRVIFVPTGEYNQQYRRPWVAHYTRDNENAIHEAVARVYHDHKQRIASNQLPQDAEFAIAPAMLTGVSSDFILPSSNYERQATINVGGGWGQQTARFMINLEIQRTDAVHPTDCILVGYTNFMGLTASGAIAQDMELNINTMYEVRSRQVPNGYGTYNTVQYLERVNQILVDDNFTGDVNTGESIRMRPFELMAAMQTSELPQLNRPNVTFTDSRIVNNSVPVFSNQTHANPNHYMATTLSGLVAGKTLSTLTGGDSPRHPFHQAANAVADASAMRDPFLLAIKNFNDGSLSNKFRWRDLVRLDPNAEHDSICFVNYRESPQRAGMCQPGGGMHIAGMTSDWHGNDRSTQVATMIANMLPSLMTDLALRGITVHAGNSMGPAFCIATNPISMLVSETVDLSPQATALGQLFKQQVVDAVSFGGQIRYELMVVADLMGEIWIKVHLEGDQPYDYVMPAYASSQMSPVMTTRRDTLDNLAESFHNLQKAALPVINNPTAADIGFFNLPSGTKY